MIFCSDGSESKFFDPGWVKFLLLGLGWVSHLWFWVWIRKISPKNVKFFNFLTLGQKVPGSELCRPLIYCGSKVCSGSDQSSLSDGHGSGNSWPGLGFFYHGSTNKKGGQSIQNRVQFFPEIKDPWSGIQIKDEAIRVMLKKTFFTYAKWVNWRF